MARTQTTGGKQKRNWRPPATEPGDKPFAEVNLDGKDKDAITRHAAEDQDDDDRDLPGGEDDEGEESPRERRFLDRSKSVSKRLGRMERSFNQRLAEQDARHQRELADLRKQNDSLRVSRGVSDTDQAAHDARIAQLNTELEAAYEKGDTKLQASITTKIAQAQGEFEAKKRAALLGQAAPTDREREPERGAPDNRGNGPTKEGQRWMRANDEWWEDPDFSIERAAAVVIDNELMDDGSDPNDPEHYHELAERLVKKFPHMKDEIAMPRSARDRRGSRDEDDDEDEDEERGSRRRPPVPAFNDRGADRGGERQPAARRGRSITLSREQRENMITFGLDPDNDDHVKEYAKSAEETARSYSREGRR